MTDLIEVVTASVPESAELASRIEDDLRPFMPDDRGFLKAIAKKAIARLSTKRQASVRNRILQFLPLSDISDEELVKTPLYQEIHKSMAHLPGVKEEALKAIAKQAIRNLQKKRANSRTRAAHLLKELMQCFQEMGLEVDRGVAVYPDGTIKVGVEPGLDEEEAQILAHRIEDTCPSYLTQMERLPSGASRILVIERTTNNPVTSISSLRDWNSWWEEIKSQALAFSPESLDQLTRLVKAQTSQRGIQRTVAIWLAKNRPHASVGVPVELFRTLCKKFDGYDVNNFAQNMTKEADIFCEVVDPRNNERLGWNLVPSPDPVLSSSIEVKEG